MTRKPHEEVGVDVDPWKVGELEFTFGTEPFMFVHVFRADDPTGDPVESDEAHPVWFDVEDIPFDRMWEDDRYWVPYLLEGTPFRGDALFDEDGEELLEWTLETDVQFD